MTGFNPSIVAIIIMIAVGMFTIGLYIASVSDAVNKSNEKFDTFLETFKTRTSISDARNNLTQYKLNIALDNVIELSKDVNTNFALLIDNQSDYFRPLIYRQSVILNNTENAMEANNKLLEGRTPLFDNLFNNHSKILDSIQNLTDVLNSTR